MGQINPFSAYPVESVSPDRAVIGDRQGRQAPRDPKRQKPQPQAEDQVELHTDADETIPTPAQPLEDHSEGGHVDVTA